MRFRIGAGMSKSGAILGASRMPGRGRESTPCSEVPPDVPGLQIRIHSASGELSGSLEVGRSSRLGTQRQCTRRLARDSKGQLGHVARDGLGRWKRRGRWRGPVFPRCCQTKWPAFGPSRIRLRRVSIRRSGGARRPGSRDVPSRPADDLRALTDEPARRSRTTSRTLGFGLRTAQRRQPFACSFGAARARCWRRWCSTSRCAPAPVLGWSAPPGSACRSSSATTPVVPSTSPTAWSTGRATGACRPGGGASLPTTCRSSSLCR